MAMRRGIERTGRILALAGVIACLLGCESEGNVWVVKVPAGTDLASVRDRVRARMRSDGERVRIVLADGAYAVTNRIDLGAVDSFVEWTAEHPGKAFVTGGWNFRLKDATATVEPDLLACLPSTVRSQVRAIRVPDWARSLVPSREQDPFFGNGPSFSRNGQTYTGKSPKDGRNRTPRYPLFTVDGAYQRLAQWPNGDRLAYGTNFVVRPVAPGTNALVRCLDDRHLRWTFDAESEISLWGFIRGCFYSTERVMAKGADPATGALEVVTTGKYSNICGMNIAVKNHARYLAMNVPEELDAPGEWYYRRKTGTLVFLPPVEATPDSVCAFGTTGDHLFDVSGRGVAFRGLVFTAKHSHPSVRFEGTEGVIEDCRFTGLGYIGLYVGGTSNRVSNCLFRDNVSCAIYLAGGEGGTNGMCRAENVLEDSLFEHNNLQETCWAKEAASVHGCGNTVRHCEFHDNACGALECDGYAHLIEYCRTWDVCLTHNDAGGVYLSGWPVTRFCTVRYNDFSSSPGVVESLYLDDTTSGHTVYGNVLRNAGAFGLLVGGGWGNLVSNNIIHACHSGLHLDARGMCWPGYKNKPVEPVDNAFVNNVMIDCAYGFDLAMPSKYSIPATRFTNSGNLYALTTGKLYERTGNVLSTGLRRLSGTVAEPLDLGFVDLPEVLCDYSGAYARGIGTNWGKLLRCLDEGFGDKPYRCGDFRLKPDARLLKELPDFKPIPWEKIGRRTGK